MASVGVPEMTRLKVDPPVNREACVLENAMRREVTGDRQGCGGWDGLGVNGDGGGGRWF